MDRLRSCNIPIPAAVESVSTNKWQRNEWRFTINKKCHNGLESIELDNCLPAMQAKNNTYNYRRKWNISLAHYGHNQLNTYSITRASSHRQTRQEKMLVHRKNCLTLWIDHAVHSPSDYQITCELHGGLSRQCDQNALSYSPRQQSAASYELVKVW